LVPRLPEGNARLDTRLRTIYARLYGANGKQHWWPGDTPFEIMVGAVLTQNTAWVNVERAIATLKCINALSVQAPACVSPCTAQGACS